MDEVVILKEVASTQTKPKAKTAVKPARKDRASKAQAPDPAEITRDFRRLMEAFTDEIKLAVPCDGIEYRADDGDQHFVAGVLDHYLCCFAIKVGQKSLGSIYFARATRFLDAELSALENRVAGLVLLLSHLCEAEIIDENRQHSDDNGQISVSAAVYDKQG